jgi:glycosyltransferase involved in cell wall biosynthesis
MAVYNAGPFVHEAVASVLAQTYADFELICVDDASTDASPAILRGFGDPRIRIIRHNTNLGQAMSRNDAMAAARGEYLAILDADDVCEPQRLERQVTFLDANAGVGLVGCGVYSNIDQNGTVLYTSRLPEDNETIQRTLVERWCFLHSSIMFRRSIQQSVGGYRKQMEPAEDHDLILRILEQSQAHNLQEPLVRYRLNPNGISVVGHRYIDEAGDIAMRMARRRRAGQPEDIETEAPKIAELKNRWKRRPGLAGAVQKWSDSFYAANRIYGFGCRELYAGNLDTAHACFVRSLRTNALFMKSWAGLALSKMPFAANRLKYAFRTSMKEHREMNETVSSSRHHSRPSVEVAESQRDQ